jgi:hypothetical protein
MICILLKNGIINMSELLINTNIQYINTTILYDLVNANTYNIKNPSSVIVINFSSEPLVVDSIVADYNIYIVSQVVSFKENCHIDISNKTPPRSRKNVNENMQYGFAGYPGSPGHNFSIQCDTIYNTENVTFTSTGSTGGDGCNGNFGGSGGIGGIGGKLIVNKNVLKTGKNGFNGNPGKNNNSSNKLKKNSIGGGKLLENNYGMDINISEYNHLIYKGVNDLNIKNINPIIKSILCTNS